MRVLPDIYYIGSAEGHEYPHPLVKGSRPQFDFSATAVG